MGEKKKRKKAEKALKKARKAAGAHEAASAAPEPVAGMPLPKELRETGAKLVALASSPVGREVIGIGLSIAAAAAQAALASKGKGADRAAGEARKAPVLADAVAAAINDFAKDLAGKVKG